MKKYLIEFYTREPKPPEVYCDNEVEKLFERIVELTKHNAKFVVSAVITPPLCDFS